MISYGASRKTLILSIPRLELILLTGPLSAIIPEGERRGAPKGTSGGTLRGEGGGGPNVGVESVDADAPESATGARDDGQLLHSGGGGDQDSDGCRDERVAGLVARDHLLLDTDQDAALLLDASHRTQDRVVEVRAAHLACQAAPQKTSFMPSLHVSVSLMLGF